MAIGKRANDSDAEGAGARRARRRRGRVCGRGGRREARGPQDVRLGLSESQGRFPARQRGWAGSSGFRRATKSEPSPRRRRRHCGVPDPAGRADSGP